MLTEVDFLKGVAILKTVGLPEPEAETMEIWYQSLQSLQTPDYEMAVRHILKTERKIQFINFVAEVTKYADEFKVTRIREQRINDEKRQLPPKDLIKPEELQKLIKNFNSKLKGV